MMRRRQFILPLLPMALWGCGGEPSCSSLIPFYSIPISISFTNSTASNIRITKDARHKGEDADLLVPPNDSTSFQLLGGYEWWATSCKNPYGSDGDIRPTSRPNWIDTSDLWLRDANTSGAGRLLYGGPMSHYLEQKALWQSSNDPELVARAGAVLHDHSLFFYPGKDIAQNHDPVLAVGYFGSDLYTSLDKWRPYDTYKGAFTLNIDVHDLDAGDIRMSVTGTLAT